MTSIPGIHITKAIPVLVVYANEKKSQIIGIALSIRFDSARDFVKKSRRNMSDIQI